MGVICQGTPIIYGLAKQGFAESAVSAVSRVLSVRPRGSPALFAIDCNREPRPISRVRSVCRVSSVTGIAALFADGQANIIEADECCRLEKDKGRVSRVSRVTGPATLSMAPSRSICDGVPFTSVFSRKYCEFTYKSTHKTLPASSEPLRTSANHN